MSEKRKNPAGIFLLTAALLLCLIPAFLHLPVHQERFRPSGRAAQSAMRSVSGENGMIRVNSAAAEELQELPGIGPAYSSLIVSEREKNGPFYYPEDLAAVRGIGPKTVEKIRGMIDLSAEESGD